MSALRLTPAVVFVSGAFALLPMTIVSAQEAGPNAPAPAQQKSQAQSSAPASSQAQGQTSGQPQAKSQPKTAPKRGQGALPSANDTATGPATSAGCGWIGKRVIHSLLRDDAVTAQDFDRLYRTFDCSPDHLRAAFDCTVAVGVLPTAVEAQTRVDSCWTDPKFDAKSMKIAPANDMPTASGAAAGAAAQPKSGAVKAAPAVTGGNNGGSTPNYPAPKSQ